jgi:cholinesterase
MFTSFARTGNPNDEVMGNVCWAPVDSKVPPFKCLNIAEELSFVEYPDSERLAYWDSMFEADKLY